jgi:hypothetical protein
MRRIIVPAVLFRLPQLRAIEAGEVDLAFRRWDRPRARAGGRQRTAIGVIAIDAVERVDDLSDDEARRAGFESRDAVLAAFAKPGDLYRIALHLEGPDPRVALRETIAIGDDLAALRRAVDRLPWARDYLRTIAEQPEVRAPDLAAAKGIDTRTFKTRVRRLKELGLTISLSPGYRLSARGEAFLEHEGPAGAGPSKP